jgi:hypothetical protein
MEFLSGFLKLDKGIVFFKICYKEATIMLGVESLKEKKMPLLHSKSFSFVPAKEISQFFSKTSVC